MKRPTVTKRNYIRKKPFPKRYIFQEQDMMYIKDGFSYLLEYYITNGPMTDTLVLNKLINAAQMIANK